MFIIINWSDYSDVAIVTNENGTPVLFESDKEAEEYAKGQLNFKWRVARLDKQ